MIHIEKDQPIAGSDHLRVATPSGDYEDMAMIEFYDVNVPDVIPGAYQAQYVQYGNLVFSYNDPKSLGEAILAIDPKSTHTAASYVRMTNELLAQMNAGSLESDSLDQVIVTEQSNMAGDMASTTDATATSTDLFGSDATTTPETTAPVFDASGTSTPHISDSSTPSTTEAIPSETSTTTPTTPAAETVASSSPPVATSTPE